MSKFGECAVRASKVLQARHDFGPNDAWAMAAREIFPSSPSSQKKVARERHLRVFAMRAKLRILGEKKCNTHNPPKMVIMP